MKLQFSLRDFLISVVLAATAICLGYQFWPRPQIPGNPNLVGIVLGPDGAPVQNATIGIHDFDRNPLSAIEPYCKTTTNKYGKFRLDSVDPVYLGFSLNRYDLHDGRFFIKVDHDTFCLANAIDKAGFNGICDKDVDLIKDLDHEFTFKMVVGGTVSGNLSFGTAKPIADSRIRLVSQKNFGYFRTFVTDQHGSFQTAALAEGRFDVEIDDSPILNFLQSRQAELESSDAKTLNQKILVSQIRPSDNFDYLNIGELTVTKGETTQYNKLVTIVEDRLELQNSNPTK